MSKIDFSNDWVDKSLPYISISQILGLLSEPFDRDGVAQRTFDNNYNNPESKYFKKTKDEIIAMWDAKVTESLRYGKLLDDYIGIVLEGTEDDKEIYELDNDVDGDIRLNGLIVSFNKFLDQIKDRSEIKYVAREKTLYYNFGDFNVKGRFDALFYNEKTNKWIVIDWKSSGTIDTVPNKWTKNLLGTAKQFPALNWYTYTMQLYFYKTALLNHYLPEGTKEEDVDVCIVNLPGDIFKIYKAAFNYDKKLMDDIFKFGYKKNCILNKKKS